MHRRHGQNLFVESSGFTHGHENGDGIVHTRITVNDEAAGWRSGAGGTRRHVCAREGAERSQSRPSERLGREVPQRRQRFCLCVQWCVWCVWVGLVEKEREEGKTGKTRDGVAIWRVSCLKVQANVTVGPGRSTGSMDDGGCVLGVGEAT